MKKSYFLATLIFILASTFMLGKSLYVNNAHYDAFDEDGNLLYFERSITKLNRHALEPVE